MRVLVVNAGSSSVKLRVVEGAASVLHRADLDAPDDAALAAALADALAAVPVDAAGHRFVHGGPRTAPMVLDDAADRELAALVDLAPLHNPRALRGVRALRRLRPGLPQVACFDTAFHATLPPAAATYALPAEWNRRWGIRRYGFHGLSHGWASRRALELAGGAGRRLVTAHIGAGASLAAVVEGRSVDTTMGFTPLEGLVMATRAGTVDPGILTWVWRHGGLSPDDVEDALERRSGLLGLSGLSGDLRVVLAAAAEGHPGAALAYDVYLHRLRAQVSAMVAAMGGVDGLVFTGGAGEGSARLRADTCAGLGFLGFRVDDGANDAGPADRLVSMADTAPFVAVVAAREDLEITRQVAAVMERRPPS